MSQLSSSPMIPASGMNTASPLPHETVAMELDTITIIETILNQLAGRVYSPVDQGYVEVGKRLLNELGEKSIATVLASYISRDKILSILTEDEIKDMTREATDAVRGMIVMKYREFEIEKSNLSIVLRIVEHSIYANLKRALDGRTLDHLANIIRINEGAKERGGFLGGLGNLNLGLFGNKKETVQYEVVQ